MFRIAATLALGILGVAGCARQETIPEYLPEPVIEDTPITIMAPVTPVSGPAPEVPHRLDKVRVGPGDIADVATTAVALWGPFDIVEMNPVFAWSGNAAPLLGFGTKIGVKHLMTYAGATPAQANLAAETSGALGACNNVAVIAGATSVVGVSLGVVCAFAYHEHLRREYFEATDREIYPGLPTL